MGRTAINVNGSMTAGTATSRLLKQHDAAIFASNDDQLDEPKAGDLTDKLSKLQKAAFGWLFAFVTCVILEEEGQADIKKPARERRF